MKGLKPLPYDARDFDLHKTFGATAAPAFPESYSVENGLWCPDQNRGGEVFNLPPMPFGCTDYTQADLCADDDRELKNPLLLENVTRANARGGIDMRESLAAAKAVFGRTAYFRVTPTYPLDFFDAIRLAMLSTRDEGRSVSVGTPWYPAWDDPHRGGILPVPASFATGGLGWHNWKVAGWKTIGGAPYLVCKMWAGPNYGDKGFVYMSRELANAVLNISGSALIFVIARLLGWEIPYTSAELENFITMAVILATPLFTMIRQVITGRATVLGGKGPAAN